MFFTIVHHYLLWHYTRAYVEFFNIWKNLLWFVVHFFSIPQLLGSWLSPWKRITETRTKAWDLEDWAGSILINLLSRIIGALMRTVVLILGFISLLAVLSGGLLVYAFWLAAPILAPAIVMLGIFNIF